MSLAIEPQPPRLAPERPQDADAVEQLVLRGAALVERACAAAAAAGHAAIVLVGDMPLFGPHGFAPAPEAVMPGPVDRDRVLAKALRPGADADLRGLVVAA
jgi:predicted N-acetyltransferase YhbS